jgi:FtsP/CotA-like multicopper oxidase with cupredoxin domain
VLDHPEMPKMRATTAVFLIALSIFGPGAPTTTPDRAQPNDNRTPAGALNGTELSLQLEARTAMWYPEGDDGAGVAVPAFAESGRAPVTPGPLIRVRAGTQVIVGVINHLATDTLVVHGLHDRVGAPVPDSVQSGIRLLPGETRKVRFRLDAPGTYYYWGTTTGRAINFRTGLDAQLTGAIIVDRADVPRPSDRILLIGMWTDTVARAYTQRKRILPVVNGRSWPHDERLHYAVGDTIHWRVINSSGDNHPMHLHGFYFRVDSRGDGVGDTTYSADSADHVVTQPMSPATTMSMTWVPERAGNWLFHCHIPEHFARHGPLGLVELNAPQVSMDHAMGAMDDMGGLVVGVEVKASPNHGDVHPAADAQRRHLRLLIRRNAGGSDSTPFYGFEVQDALSPAPPADPGLRVGPPLVLTRGQPVSISVVNTLAEPTSVHWHGIELESYFDGVAGFSGSAQRVSPLIAPRDSFEVRFTPPRAGTFIYHTHANELRQQPAGLAGPIVVLEPGATWDPTTDHTITITSPWSFEDARQSELLNGSATPSPIVMHAGVPQRLRIVGMMLRHPALWLELMRDNTLVPARDLAKDGADLPSWRRVSRAAIRTLSIGETLDMEVTPDAPGDLRLDVRLGGLFGNHPLFATMPIRVLARAERK